MTQKIVHSLEEISPEKARAYLATSSGNRKISMARVAAMARQMKNGNFPVTNQSIGFDDAGKLLDGHHRLMAIVQADLSVFMAVTRGLDPSVKGVIDTGVRVRSMRDILYMRKEQNPELLAPYVHVCANILAGGEKGGGNRVIISTEVEYDRWMSLFGDGVRWAVNLFRASTLKRADVAGSLAFAYPANPEKVNSFAVKLRDGEGLVRTDPAWLLRRLIFEGFRGLGGAVVIKGGATMRRKTLRCAVAEVNDEKIQRLEDNDIGVKYFRKYYDNNPIAAELSEDWTNDTQRSLTLEQVLDRNESSG